MCVGWAKKPGQLFDCPCLNQLGNMLVSITYTTVCHRQTHIHCCSQNSPMSCPRVKFFHKWECTLQSSEINIWAWFPLTRNGLLLHSAPRQVNSYLVPVCSAHNGSQMTSLQLNSGHYQHTRTDVVSLLQYLCTAVIQRENAASLETWTTPVTIMCLFLVK